MLSSENPRTRVGLTIVELLIAGSILVILLGLGGAFLAQQTTLQRAVQARNDVQDRVRVVMQVVTQDLSLAGNSMLVNPDGTILRQQPGLCRNVQDPNILEPCFTLAIDEATQRSTIFIRYLSSQFPALTACRDVTYWVENGNLIRSDVPCGTVGTAPVVFASSVEAFQVLLVCGNGIVRDRFDAATGCAPTYPRSAIVTFGSASDIRVGSGQSTLSYTDLDGDSVTVTCDANSICYLLSQEVLMPNLKDR